MKRIITTIALTLIAVIFTNAQVKLPKINTSTGELITQKQSEGLKIDLSKVKSLKDLQGLNIPRAEISREKLAEKSRKQWKVSPWKMTDGTLVITRVHGTYQNKQYVLRSSFIARQYDRIPIPGIDNGVDIIVGTFPITIEFRAAAKVEYRLKLKHGGSYHHNSEILVTINDEVQSVRMNRQKEFNLIFMEEASKKLEIIFSGLVNPDKTPRAESLIVSEISVEELQRI